MFHIFYFWGAFLLADKDILGIIWGTDMRRAMVGCWFCWGKMGNRYLARRFVAETLDLR